MQLIIDVQSVLSFLGVVLLLLLIVLVGYIISIVRDAKRLVRRVESLTDVKGWFSMFKRFKK